MAHSNLWDLDMTPQRYARSLLARGVTQATMSEREAITLGQLIAMSERVPEPAGAEPDDYLAEIARAYPYLAKKFRES